MKEIKQKKSYLSGFFNDTDAGNFIAVISVIIFSIAGAIFVPYGIGKFILFLFRPYMSKDLINDFTRNTWLVGLVCLMVMVLYDFTLSNMLNREMTDKTRKAIADLEAGRKETKINENKTKEITF